jgi:hypothetical protein
MQRVLGDEMRAEFWSGNLKGRDQLENLGVDVTMILELILSVMGDVNWVRLAGTGTNCDRLATR